MKSKYILIFVIICTFFIYGCNNFTSGSGDLKFNADKNKFDSYPDELIKVGYELTNNMNKDLRPGRTIISLQGYEGIADVDESSHSNEFLFKKTSESQGGVQDGEFKIAFTNPGEHELRLSACTFNDNSVFYELCLNEKLCQNDLPLDKSNSVYPSSFSFDVIEKLTEKKGRIKFAFAKKSGLSAIREQKGFNAVKPSISDKNNICLNYANKDQPYNSNALYFEVYFADGLVDCFGERRVNFYDFKNSNDIVCEFDITGLDADKESLEIKYNYYFIQEEKLKFNIKQDFSVSD